MKNLICVNVNNLKNYDDELELKNEFIKFYGKEKIKNLYYIAFENDKDVPDFIVAREINVDFEKYKQILIKNKAKFDLSHGKNNTDLVFYSQQECKNAIKELEPYIIMAALIK